VSGTIGTGRVTSFASGQSLSGPLDYIDDFFVSFRDADRSLRSFKRDSVLKVQIHNPLQAHGRSASALYDADIHNVTATFLTEMIGSARFFLLIFSPASSCARCARCVNPADLLRLRLHRGRPITVTIPGGDSARYARSITANVHGCRWRGQSRFNASNAFAELSSSPHRFW